MRQGAAAPQVEVRQNLRQSVDGQTCANCRATVASWWLAEHPQCPCCGYVFAAAT